MKLQSFDPSNGDLLGEVNIAATQDITNTLNHARSTLASWKRTPIEQRVALVENAFKSLSIHQNELAELLCKEMGKKHDRGMSEVRGSIFVGMHYAKQAASALTSNSQANIEYRALGVCAVISPWNYPLAMAVNLIVPALIAGNTVVFKPSEQTPLIAERFVSLLNESLPNGVLSILHGDGAVGSALAQSDEVNLIAFTGSLAVGKQIMKASAGNLKRLVMELGGNDPMIVLDDADLDAAARFAVASSFENSGQMCTSTERIYVMPQIADEFIAKVKHFAAQYQVGPWNDANSQLGPIVSYKQLNKIQTHVNDAAQKGANIILGGDSIQEHYFAPTVVTGLTEQMLMEQQETFGPVVAIATVNSIEEAITRANNSIYGLGAVVFGHQGARDIANQLEAGMIGINKGPGGSGDSPWVGAKQSGYGFHGSVEGHRLFAQTTVVE